MDTFAFVLMEEYDYCALPVCRLLRNGRCMISDFLDDLKTDGNLNRETRVIHAHIENLADLKPIPDPSKHKRIFTHDNQPVYEVKSKNLRLYYIPYEGKIVVVGYGKKNTQKTDINKLKGIIRDFCNYNTPIKMITP